MEDENMGTKILSTASSLFLGDPTSAEPVQIISSPKNVQNVTMSNNYNNVVEKKPKLKKMPQPGSQYKWDIVWKNVFLLSFVQFSGMYGVWLIFTRMMWKTVLFNYLYAYVMSLGVTAGAHRLWAHRTYKAKLPLRIFLMIGQTAMLQNCLFEWVRDHRVHHKFTDTDADPHNASRGFFFSHMGWLMIKKHNDVKVRGKAVDMSDIVQDPVVKFQRKYYEVMTAFLTFIIPTLIPWYYFGENFYVSWLATMWRYFLSLHFTWLVNSAAHIWGTKPYDKTVNPTENKFVAVVSFGEGWHNYHHVFPWDYKAAELGNYRLNFTTAFLDFMAYIGQAYDMKVVSEDMVKRRVNRTGDGSWRQDKKQKKIKVDDNDGHHHHHHHNPDENMIWGWGDKDMKEEDINDIRKRNGCQGDVE